VRFRLSVTIAGRVFRFGDRADVCPLEISGVDVGPYHAIEGDAWKRPENDRERAIWYCGYSVGRTDREFNTGAAIPTAGIPEGEGDE
jgi:hypothetical protein